MTTAYATHFSTRQTPQSEPIPGKPMVQNTAGGFAFQIDDWKRLERFLVLGCDGGTYYASEKALTVENAQCVLRCANEDPERAVRTIAAISQQGRAPKNDAAIFAIAILAGHDKAKPYALAAVSQVCRIGTHLFQFVEAVEKFRGWGRSLKRAVGQFYLSQKPRDLAYQVTKYQQRNGWSHRDVLRLAKPKAEGPTNTILRWAVGKQPEFETLGTNDFTPIVAFEHAKAAAKVDDVVRLITEYDLVRECIPTQWLNSPEVWEALLVKMPVTAMIRNLGKMSAVGLLKPMSQACITVAERLRDRERLRKARVHPLAILVAQRIYASGHGVKGKLTWQPDRAIIDALDDAFYLAFDAVEPTGKRHLIGLDVSGSMGCGQVAGSPLTPREGACAMAMVAMRTEPYTHVVGFTGRGFVPAGQGADRRFSYWGSSNPGVEPLPLTPKQRLDDAVRSVAGLPMGPTDCALPMLYATENKIPVDVFEIITDNESWQGQIHATQALQQYRERMGIPAKMVVIAMTATQFSVSDPSDFRQMDVVGFDTNVPAVVGDFIRS